MSRAPIVAFGILASRLAGVVRTIAIGMLVGLRPEGDVLAVVFRAPNLIQNLLGEQALSASFIPVYSRLVAEGRRQDAGRLAGAIFGLLTLVASAAALIGVLAARPLVALTAPGFLGDAAAVSAGTAEVDRYLLAVKAVRIVFPMTALLAMSAWALSVLNSHRRFLVPYLAPVAWNAAIIAAMALAGLRMWNVDAVVLAACWGGLIGGALQFLVQLPSVARVVVGFRPSLSLSVEGVRRTLRAFGPSVAGRGVVQLSSYVDMVLASLLLPGAAIAIDLAQRLYLLPISLFGGAVAAAELPELARDTAAGGDPTALRERLRRALLQAGGAAIPAAVGLCALSVPVVAALLERGRFGPAEVRLVALILAVCAFAIVPTVLARVMQNTYFALGDTASPAKIALVRLVVGASTASLLMFPLDRIGVSELPGFGPLPEGSALHLGACGLAVGLVVTSWTEAWLLLRGLTRRIGGGLFPLRPLLGSTGRSVVSAGMAWSLWFLGDGVLAQVPSNLARGMLVGGLYVLVWLTLAWWVRDPVLRLWTGREPATMDS